MQYSTIIILGLESSCDETAVSILRFDQEKHEILAENVASQITEHQPFGGVVPEIAARAHMRVFPELINQTLQEANMEINDLSAIAATTGPGLIGGLLVGSMIGRAMALQQGLPFYGIHHLEGHVLTPRLADENFTFPYLVLLASGGHTMLIIAHRLGEYEILGKSKDDALGEAFDKSSMIMDLGYPGGPVIEKFAKTGEASRFALPSPLVGSKDRDSRLGCDFSFSGLKTAVSRHWQKIGTPDDAQAKADMSASLQQAVGIVLKDRLANALEKFHNAYPEHSSKIPVAFVGGVSANRYLYQLLDEFCQAQQARLAQTPLKWCTDNATMIAWAGLEHIRSGHTPKAEHDMTRPRWSIEDLCYG